MFPYAPALLIITKKIVKNLNGYRQDINKHAMEKSYTGILSNDENECRRTAICINTNHSQKKALCECFVQKSIV